MASVYEKALLTLAATAADDRAGLFVQSNLHDLATLPRNAQDPRSPPVYFTAHIAQPHDWDRHILNAPLNSRAWVMQERILSRRIVHFAGDQLYWECRRQRSSQTGITYADNKSSAFSMIQRQSPANADRYLIANADVHSFITNMQELLSKHETKISSDRSLRGAFGHLWMTLIEAYAHCNLTDPSDKLPALTGLAVRLQAAAGISHIYGHWFHGLVPLMPLLLWYAPGHAAWKKDDGARPDGGGLTRPRRQRCPAWSWASMDGGVSFLTRFEYESFATLVAVETAARDGLDVHASLIFRGCIFKARRDDARNQSADGEHWNWDSYRSYGYRMVGDCVSGERLGRVFFDVDDEEPEIFDCIIMCRGDMQHEGENYRVLALKEVGSQSGEWPEFRRIGAGTFNPDLVPSSAGEMIFALV